MATFFKERVLLTHVRIGVDLRIYGYFQGPQGIQSSPSHGEKGMWSPFFIMDVGQNCQAS